MKKLPCPRKPFLFFLLFWGLGQPGFVYSQNELPETPDPNVSAPSEEKAFPYGGFLAAKKEFSSFEFHSKRAVSVSQNGTKRSRWDKVKIQKDDKDHLHYKKTSSEANLGLEFFWIDKQVYRPDKDLLFKPPSAPLVFQPILSKTTRYWEEFWNRFSENYQWKKEGGAQWNGRKCDRIVIGSLNPSDKRPHLKGEILIDQQTGLALKTQISAEYQSLRPLSTNPESSEGQSNPPPDATEKPSKNEILEKPFMIKITLKESLKKIDKVPLIQFPKSAQKTLASK